MCVKTQITGSMENFLERLEGTFDKKIDAAVQPLLGESLKAQQHHITALTEKFFVASGNHTKNIQEMQMSFNVRFSALQDRLTQLETHCSVLPPPSGQFKADQSGWFTC